MPTAARLISALLFAALAWGVSEILRGTLPEGVPARYLAPVVSGLGLVFGWQTMGARAGQGQVAAVAHALTTLGLIVVWALIIFSGAEMVRRSMRRFYDGPMEGLEAMVGLFLEYGRLLLVPEVAIAGIAGALVCGAIAAFVARRSG